MKPRTLQVASSFAHYIGALFGIAILAVAVCEGIAGCCLLLASERED